MNFHTATKNITAVKMPYEHWDGSKRYEKRTIADIQGGRYIDLILLANGDLHVRLTGEGRAELREKLAYREQAEQKIADLMKSGDYTYYQARSRYYSLSDDAILADLVEDFCGNGWSYTDDLDTWGHMTSSPAFSDDLSIDDYDNKTYSRLWMLPDYALYPTTLERLQFGNLIFKWWGPYLPKDSGVPEMPETMHLW